MFNAVTFEVTLPTSGQKPMQTLASWGKKQPNEGIHGICQWFSSSSQFANTLSREREIHNTCSHEAAEEKAYDISGRQSFLK
jgi:hypothetical protein